MNVSRTITAKRHYDDEALIFLMETNLARADDHLPSCPVCAEKLESFRMIAGALEESDVWDSRALQPEPVQSTISNLRAFADRMSFEDTLAEPILRELLAGAREEWMPRLQQHPEWRTAGVVRKLVEETTRILMTVPPDAMEMTALSTEIADHLDPTTFSSDTVARLRGAAWRDRAYVLFYVGRYAESVKATERAELNLDTCVVDEYDRARVSIVKALALHPMEETVSATSHSRFSTETFTRFGDLTRLAAAQMTEAQVLFSSGKFKEALAILEPLELRLRETDDLSTHAQALANLAYSYWQLGRIEEAVRNNETAAAMCEAIGLDTECTRLRWNNAAILAGAGRVDDAFLRFEMLQKEFDELEMIVPAAMVRLDIAELLLVREEFAGVEAICRAAMRSFEQAGISYSPRAMTALAFIQEAARHRTVTPVLIRHVREYLRELPRDGERLFAPPPG